MIIIILTIVMIKMLIGHNFIFFLNGSGGPKSEGQEPRERGSGKHKTPSENVLRKKILVA